MARWLSFMLILMVVLVGCTSNGDDDNVTATEAITESSSIDPLDILTQASDNIRSADTFRLEIIHSGADYFANITMQPGDISLSVAFRRALAQYVAPNQLQGRVRVVAGAAVEVDVYAQGTDQWLRFPMTDWIHDDFAGEFDPQVLIAEDTGFHAALSALRELEYVEETTLDTGDRVHHLHGLAEGRIVTDLLVGLIEATGEVAVDVFINRDAPHYPVRLIVVQFDTITEQTPDPTTWTIDIFDINGEPDIEIPGS